LSNPILQNPLNVDLSTIGALIDTRVQNLAVVTTSGVDLTISYQVQTVFGTLATGLQGTYILRFDNQVTSGLPTVSYLNTPFNPVKVKARGDVAWNKGPMALAVFGNFVSSYEDNRTVPIVPIASWMTFDVTGSYSPMSETGIFKNSSIMFSIINAFNRDPPFVANQVFPVYFDGANANPLGRMFAIQLAKRY
jgi:outer membrane receptor protein involved in Fe transport